MTQHSKAAKKASAKKRKRRKKAAQTAQEPPVAEVSAYVDETEFAADDSECVERGLPEDEDRPLVLSGGYIGEDEQPGASTGAYHTVVVESPRPGHGQPRDLRQAGQFDHFGLDEGFSYTEGTVGGASPLDEGQIQSTGIFETIYGFPPTESPYQPGEGSYANAEQPYNCDVGHVALDDDLSTSGHSALDASDAEAEDARVERKREPVEAHTPGTAVALHVASAPSTVGAEMTSYQRRSLLERSKYLKRGCPFPWMDHFISIQAMPITTEELRLQKFSRLSSLAADFVHTAKRYGKIIISEKCLPNEQRTINIAHVGGEAGGEKYVYHGILFKFALNWRDIFPSEFHAQKAAGHELVGVMRYAQQRGLHVPLMALIDYRGYRLVAEALLPLNPTTLVYGSGNSGNDVYNRDSTVAELMKAAAENLNLKGHVAGRRAATREFLYAPADIEGHRAVDGKIYVIDFARVFPPTAEQDVKKTYLYKLFRPEFIKNYRIPLSSDAFSPFGRDKHKEHDNEVIDATRHLMEVVVPEVGAELDKRDPTVARKELTELVHRAGINVRYLGLIRGYAPRLSVVILTEMCARAIKNMIRGHLRDRRQGSTIMPLGDDAYRQVVIEQLNLVLGCCESNSGEERNTFWTSTVKQLILDQFRDALSPEELAPTYDLRQSLDVTYRLFKRIGQLTGIKLTKQALIDLKENPDTFCVVASDIKKISARVKHMNIVSLAEGNALAIKARRSEAGSERLFRLAMSKFETAIRATPDNRDALNNYGDVLVEYARTTAADSDSACFPFVSKAFEKYRMARNWPSIFKLATVLQKLQAKKWKERDQLLSLAHDCYQVVSDEAAASSCTEGLWSMNFICWGNILVQQARRTKQDPLYQEAGAKYRMGLQACAGSERDLWEWASKLSDVELAVLMEVRQQSPDLSVFDCSWLYKKRLLTPNLLVELAKHCSLVKLVLEDCVEVAHSTLVAMSKHLSALTKLNLAGITGLDDSTLIRFKHCSHLTSLNLSGCTRITNRSLEVVFESCSQLESLNLSHCTDIVFNFIHNLVCYCQDLRKLHLAGCQYLGASQLSVLTANLRNLETLDIAQSNCFAQGQKANAVKQLGRALPGLRRLILRDCDVTTNMVVTILQNKRNLVELDLSNGRDVSLGLPAFEAIAQCTELTRLSLGGCHSMTDEALDVLRGGCRALRELDLTECCGLSGAAVAHLLRTYRGLEALKLNGVKRVSDRSLEPLDPSLAASAGGCPALRVLELRYASVSNVGIRHIARGCPNLEELDIGWNEKHINDESLRIIAQGCTRLRRLNVDRCKDITDHGICSLGTLLHLESLHMSRLLCVSRLHPLAEGCPFLKHLDLSQCNMVTGSSVRTLVQALSLETLDVFRCKNIKDEDLRVVVQSPGLRLLVIGANKVGTDTYDELVTSVGAGDELRVVKRQTEANFEARVRRFSSSPGMR